MAASYRLDLHMDQLLVLVARARFPMSSPAAVRHLGDAVRAYGAMVQARAVRNVSGYPVSFEGGYFVVRVQTGALKGSIELEWPYGATVFQARVYVNGAHFAAPAQGGFLTKPRSVSEYAAAIEQGHEEIDLKKTMMGKTVPFFAAERKDPRGPFTAGGLKPVTPGERGYGSSWQSQVLNSKLAAKGKDPMHFTKKGGKGSGSTYFIAFRRVGKTGWIIPKAEPRPFMRAAVEGTREQGRLMMVRAGVQMLNPQEP